MMSCDSKIALFIDGPNLHAAAKALGFEVDYRRLLEEFQSRGRLVRAFYYTVLVEDHDNFSVRPLVDFLDYNGFTVVTKLAKDFTDLNGHRNAKGNMKWRWMPWNSPGTSTTSCCFPGMEISARW